MKDSPFPSSTRKDAATLLGDWFGISVPSAVMRIRRLIDDRENDLNSWEIG